MHAYADDVYFDGDSAEALHASTLWDKEPVIELQDFTRLMIIRK